MLKRFRPFSGLLISAILILLSLALTRSFITEIRDMAEEWKKPCLDLMQGPFLRDEPICKTLGIKNDPESIATIRANWEGYVSQSMALACFTEVDGKPDELVGFNVTFVKSRHDKEEDFDKIKGELWKKVLTTLTVTEELMDVFSHYGVDEILTNNGLTVLPKYRGQKIGDHFFLARKHLCEAVGVRAVSTVCTNIASQIIATRCGYDLLAELNYADMMAYGIDLSSCTTPTAKLMGTKIN